MSSGMLSKIERGQLFPTLPTLLKIAMVFGVGLEHFFVDLTDRPTLAVVRKKDRLRLPDRPDAENPSYFFESLDFPSATGRWRPMIRSSNRTRERRSPTNIQAQRLST